MKRGREAGAASERERAVLVPTAVTPSLHPSLPRHTRVDHRNASHTVKSSTATRRWYTCTYIASTSFTVCQGSQLWSSWGVTLTSAM
jgi:hypothetical protein